MRNHEIFFLLILVVLMLFSFLVDKPYKDGSYIGSSKSIYVDEPFYGFAKIVIEKGKIVQVRYWIRDSLNHEYFDGKYEKYFVGNEVYVQQCRNDWKGVQAYPDKLLKSQDIDDVDAITGATWSYNIFKASIQEALSASENTK